MSASSIRQSTMAKYEIRINEVFQKFKEFSRRSKKIQGGFQEVKQIPGEFQEISQKIEIPGVFQELLEFQEAARTLVIDLTDCLDFIFP